MRKTSGELSIPRRIFKDLAGEVVDYCGFVEFVNPDTPTEHDRTEILAAKRDDRNNRDRVSGDSVNPLSFGQAAESL